MTAISIWALSSCGEEQEKNGLRPPPPEIYLQIELNLEGVDGRSPAAGDTLVSRVVLVSVGEATAWGIAVSDSMNPRFNLLGAESTPDARITLLNPVRMDSLNLAPGDTAVLTVRALIPERFPDGFMCSSRAWATYHQDSLGADPAVWGGEDQSVATLSNEGLDFSVLAPGVTEMYLAGDFNGWSPQSAVYRMFQDAEESQWGLTLPGVSGRQAYKFVVHQPGAKGVEWIGDPRATRVSDDGYGGLNSVAGVPLPDPPDRVSGGIDPTRLVIYELLTYDFSSTGDLAGLIAGLTGGLQNLADLGINAVELLPMTAALPGGFNWGYTPGQYFSVDPDYGTPEQMAEFVEAAHDHGIAVLLDMVFNHCAGNSPLALLDQVGTQGTFINHSQEQAFGMPQLNWFSEDTRRFLLDAALFWIEQYGVDGFRMDMVDSREYPWYQWWRNQIKARHPEVFIIGEDFALPPWNSVVQCGMDAQWGGQHTDQWGCPSGGYCPNNFQQMMMAVLEEDPYLPRWDAGVGVGCFESGCNPMWALANVIEPTAGYPTYHNEIKYIVSHDERRVVWEVQNSNSLDARAIGGIRKAKLGAATLLTAVGIPMIYMGEEIGADNEVGQHPALNRVDWSAGSSELRSYYRTLIELRLNHPTLAAGGIDFHCPSWGSGVPAGSCQVNKTLCYWRYAGSTVSSADVVVAVNYDHDDHAFEVEFPASGPWYQFDPDQGTTPINIQNNSLTMTLAASTAYIFLTDNAYLP